jgi:hypothetical protein
MPIFAQDGEIKTLLSGDIDHGGFGGPVVKFGNVYDESAVMIGGRGGWIIDHFLSLGGGGYGLVTEITTRPEEFLLMGYGGFELEFIIASNRLLHSTVGTLVGAGWISSHDRNLDPDAGVEEQGDTFFVMEPSVNAELNVARFMRVNAGVSYRYTDGADKYGITDTDLSGLNAVITLKFGAF